MSSKNLGPGVSGYLNPDERAWETAVFQAGKPVLDKELNLQQDIDGGAGQLALRQGMPTGWLSASFLASSVPDVGASSTANSYDFERMVAHVNGWIIPVQNTGMNDTTNTLDLKIIGQVNSPDNDPGTTVSAGTASGQYLVSINRHRFANQVAGV